MPAQRMSNRAGRLAILLVFVMAGLVLPAQASAAVPETPAPPAVTTDGQSLDVSWTAPADGGSPLTGYVVQVVDAADEVVASFRVAADTLEHQFAGLDDGSYTVTVTALNADGASASSGGSAAVEVDLGLHARYTFDGLENTAAGAAVPDASGNGHVATIRGNGTTVNGSALVLPGGGSASGAGHVELPSGLFEGHDTLTISAWLRNQTASGNYAALFFGSAQNPPSRYFLLNPKNPSGRLKSVITDAPFSTSAPWGTERGFSPTTASRGVPGPITDSSWGLYTTVIEPGQITAYLNGEKIGTVAHSTPVSTFGANLVGYIGRSSYPDVFYQGGVRDVRIHTTALTDATVAAHHAFDKALADAAALEVPAQTAVDLDLPETGARGSQITWTSSEPSVISTGGAVTRSTEDVVVTLSAAVTQGGKHTVREFEVTVLADDPAADVARVADAYDVAISKVTDDIVLRTEVEGVDIAWASSDPAVLTPAGEVSRPDSLTDVTLTATFSRAGHTTTREYDVSVLPADAGRIGTHIRSGDTNRTDAIHLAHAEGESTTFAPLHNGRPVRYANSGSVKLGGPTTFRKPNGRFGLIATVNSASSSIHVYDSADLITFRNERVVSFNGVGLTASSVHAAYDNGIAAYRLTFTALGDGRTYQVRTKDFESFSAPVEVDAPAPAAPATFPAGALEASSIGVTADEYDAVLRKYTRMVNTGVEPLADVTVPTGGTPELPEAADVTYSNGGASTRMPVEWDEADLAAVDTTTPGEYVVGGTVTRPSYPAKLAHQRADPDVTLGDDGLYYLTGSYPQVGNNPEGYDRVVLRRADTIAGLADAEEVVLWDEENSALQRYVWAPELAKIKDTWYILFTASRSSNVFDIRPMLLRHTGGDLMDPANWVEVGAMLAQSGDRAFTSFSLDMTHFEHGGRHYVSWAQSAPSSALLLAEINPDNPRQLISPSVTIAYPELAWEGNTATNQYIDEGAAVIKRGGKIYMSFSASTVNELYTVGLLTADEDADLLDPASWHKTAYPLLATADLPAGETGPGHNSFTVDELGNPVIVYHSRTVADMTDGGLTDPSRHARARTVHFDGDGDPVFNMTAEEELAEEHRDVEVRVVVEETPATVPGPTGTPIVTKVSAAGATVSWAAPSETGGAAITGYRVRVHQGEEQVLSEEVTGRTIELSGLAADTAYTVTVEARNHVGFGPASTPVEFTTASVPDPIVHYPLESDLSETVESRDATAVGPVTFDDGMTLPGASTSSSNHVRLPDNLLQGAGESLTVSVWIKSDTPPRNGAAVAFGTPPVNNLPANYWLLNPTAPNGSARSVMTNSVNATQPWTTEVQVAGPDTTGRRGSWTHFTTVFTPTSLTSYVDGAKIGSVAKTRTFADFMAAGTLEGYLGRSGYAGDAAFKGSFRELQIFDAALTDDQVGELTADDRFILDAARERLSLGDTSAVSADLTLPASAGDGVDVSWETSDASVVTSDGAVSFAATSRTATLTATLSRGGSTVVKEFSVTVVSMGDLVAAAADLLVAPGVLASGDSLPTVPAEGVTTTWSTLDEALEISGTTISADARAVGDVTAVITAAGADPVTKTFEVTVLPGDRARFLLGYTRTPLATQTYSSNLAFGLHLALGGSREGVAALNENHGIVYARAVPTGTVERNAVRNLRDPFVFGMPDGTYGVVATRTLSDGTPDDSAEDSLLLFTSPDLLTYTEVGLVEVNPQSSGVRKPQVHWDSAEGRFVVSWRTADGTWMHSTTTDLTDAGALSAPAPGRVLTASAEATTNATGAVPGNTVVIDVATARALRTRFARIQNTGAEVDDVEVGLGEELDLDDVRAHLSYDDGSTASRAVDWDADDLAAVDTGTPGTYQVAGTVRQTDYSFPFIVGRADPDITRWKGKYLFLATESAESKFFLRSSDTINGLPAASDHLILETGAGLPGPLWAPEFHDIGGRLFVLFAAGVDQRCWCAVQAHVMELEGDDPTDPADWGAPQLVQKREGGRLQLDADHPGISLDMTYFEDERDGETVSYVAWSQRYIIPGTTGDAQMWIATIDPEDPSRLTSDPVLFNSPEFGWDLNTSAVVEGPYVIRRGDTLYMTYSGSNIDSTYAVGLLTAPAGGDLLDPDTWTKLNHPVLKSDPTVAQLGPGHNMFSVDEDGNEIIVYHARNNGGSRDSAVRRIHWASDGMPILDMTKDEEVAPAHREVSMTVTVGLAADTTAPDLSVSTDPASPSGKRGWFTGPVSLVAQATDPEVPGAERSGGVEIEQRIGAGPWTAYAAPLALPQGESSVAFRATDAAGNTSAPVVRTVGRDSVAPRVKVKRKKNRSTRVRVVAGARDAHSGVARLHYRVDGGGWERYTRAVVVRAPGRHTVRVRAFDRAGNVSVRKVRLRVRR